MKIISFSGKSGTGKSYQATALAQRRGFDAIIDDGLLIYKGRIVAGRSAKRCSSKAAAMRTCLFNYEDHRNDIKQALVKYHPETLMIIGTSDRMTNIIAEALGLHEPDERIYIEDVTTEEQRETAHFHRHVQGEHVIPAPMGQLRRDFAGYFMNPMKKIMEKALGQDMEEVDIPTSRDDDGAGERTVVRPQYSYFGQFAIMEKVLRDIIEIVAKDFSNKLVVLDKMGNGKETNMDIVVDVRVLKDRDAVQACKDFQKAVYEAIENITSFSVSNVNIRIKDVESNILSLKM